MGSAIPRGTSQHSMQLPFDRGHERVALAASFSAGAHFDRLTDGDLGFDGSVYRDLAGQIFFEPLHRFDDPALGRILAEVAGRVVVELLCKVGVFE